MGWIIFEVVLSPFTYAFTRFFFRPKFPLFTHATSFSLNFLIFIYEFSSIFYVFLCLFELIMAQITTMFAIFRHTKKAMTEMVPDLIWASDFWSTRNLIPKKFGPKKFGPKKFGPQEIWSPRNLVPKKFGSSMKIILQNFMQRPNFSGTKFLAREPNFSGSKKASGPNEIGDHFSCSFEKDFTPMLI